MYLNGSLEKENHVNIEEEEDLVKHVKIPKVKKNKPFYYNKNKINEINEYFFDE